MRLAHLMSSLSFELTVPAVFVTLSLSSSHAYSGRHEMISPDHVFSRLIVPRAVGWTCQKRVGGVTKGRAATAGIKCLVRS